MPARKNKQTDCQVPNLTYDTKPLFITPFNPLSPDVLGDTIRRQLLEQECYPLDEVPNFDGAGVYAIYYSGDSPYYQPIAEANRDKCTMPIYVGKADPPGARKGIVVRSAGPALYGRLKDHADSIRSVSSANKPGTPEYLDIKDFRCRFLVVDITWIPLLERVSITGFQPPWNGCIDGFGHHNQGVTRQDQQKSLWDTLHPGRWWAFDFQKNELSVEQIAELLRQFFVDPTKVRKPPRRRKKKIEEPTLINPTLGEQEAAEEATEEPV